MAIQFNSPDATSSQRVTPTPEQLMPKRNPGLISRIASAIFATKPDYGTGTPGDDVTTGTGIVSEGLVSLYDRQFKFDVTRRATYKDVEEIDQASEEASIALDAISNNVCTSEDGVQMSFEIMAKDNPKAQKIFDQVVQTCKLHHKILPLVRNLVKYGDFFAEIVVNGNLEISMLKALPPITMFRNETLSGQLLTAEPKYDPKSGKVMNGNEECAFEQKAETTGNLIATFWPWQILHIRLNHDGFSPYGKSHLRVARVTYKKLKAIEEALIVGRLTREFLKLIFTLDTTGLSQSQAKTALSEFQNSVMQRVHVDGRRENPFSVMTDFFLTTGWIKMGNGIVQPRKTSIDTIDPKNAGIHDITDVEYLHRKFLAALRVPPAHLGFEKDVNAKATLTIQDVQYVRLLRSIQQLVGQGLEQVFDTALILGGLDPEQVDYEIVWPALVTSDQVSSAQAELYRAQAYQIYNLLKVIDPLWMQKHQFNLTDEEIEEINQNLANIDAQQQAQQVQKADMDTNRAVEVAKAKVNASGFVRKDSDKPVQSRVNRHSPGEDDVPGAGNANKDITQEVRLLSHILSGKVESLLGEDMRKVALSLNGIKHD